MNSNDYGYISDLSMVLRRMDHVIKPVASVGWLYQENVLLDNEQPIDLIKRGEAGKVLALLDSLAEGVML